MIDIFILVVAVWALFSGWRNGLVKEIASSIGFFVGLFIAVTCYSTFGSYLAVNGSEGNMVTSIVAFFILWIVTPIVLGLAANILTRVFKNLHLGGLNSIAGATVRLLKFTILLSCVLSAMSALHIINEDRVADSRLYEPVRSVVSRLVDYALDSPDEPQKCTPADRPATLSGDTVWVDVSKR